MKDNILQLRKFVEKLGYKFSEEDFTPGGKTVLCTINVEEDVSLYIIFLRVKDKYLAYGLNSEKLPRELYTDSTRHDFSENERNNEIIANVEVLLNKSINFHTKNGLFGKTKGFIELPIDGEKRKVHMKSNYFNLPMT